MTTKLSELIYEMAEQEFGEHPHDEPYEGAGYCVCDYCQKLAPAAIALENEVEKLNTENQRLESELAAAVKMLADAWDTGSGLGDFLGSHTRLVNNYRDLENIYSQSLGRLVKLRAAGQRLCLAIARDMMIFNNDDRYTGEQQMATLNELMDARREMEKLVSADNAD